MSAEDNKLDEQVKAQIAELLGVIEQHQSNMTSAVESLKQASRGTVSILHFKSLKKALGSFTEARKSVETAKRLVKNWALNDLKED